MSEQRSFALPDVGEGLTEAEILRWHVRPGDTVQINQLVVEIETAKAAVELPCPFAGTVTSLDVEVGTIVPVGTPIITIATESSTPAPERQAVLVGYGVREESVVTRRQRRGVAPAAVVTDSLASASVTVRAKPPVRKLARDRGIDLATVAPSGAAGEVTREDVLRAGGGAATESMETRPASTPMPSAGERVPVRGVQRAMAEAMVQSAFTAPHVTEWVDVDMTRALEVVARLREDPRAAELRITPMVLVAAGLVRAASAYPRINSSWVDGPDGAEVHLHPTVNLGIAADTPRGLIVPTIRNADSLGLLDLAAAIRALVETARAGAATPADLTGGTITLTNIGVFGIDGGTPILNPGQVGILAMGRILDRAWVVEGAIVPRPVMQLSLSFDHRVVDGALGSRVLQSVALFLADPALSMLLDRER